MNRASFSEGSLPQSDIDCTLWNKFGNTAALFAIYEDGVTDNGQNLLCRQGRTGTHIPQQPGIQASRHGDCYSNIGNQVLGRNSRQELVLVV